MLDASIIAKLIMREEDYRRAAEQIEAHGETMDLALIEVSNVILKYYKRGELSLQEARERFKELQELSKTLKILRSREFLEQAFETALERSDDLRLSIPRRFRYVNHGGCQTGGRGEAYGEAGNPNLTSIS
ncbi:MAG: hypothetical protein DRN68_01855 [Thaumarchaeota archaeon]|nr:MAG: hypothetical protein DRN68_01855 [Nitrososphaerota archaeon]